MLKGIFSSEYRLVNPTGLGFFECLVIQSQGLSPCQCITLPDQKEEMNPVKMLLPPVNLKTSHVDLQKNAAQCLLVSPAQTRLRQEDPEFEISLVYTMKCVLTKWLERGRGKVGRKDKEERGKEEREKERENVLLETQL